MFGHMGRGAPPGVAPRPKSMGAPGTGAAVVAADLGKKKLYKMVVQFLMSDGKGELARTVAESALIEAPSSTADHESAPEGHRLAALVKLGLTVEAQRGITAETEESLQGFGTTKVTPLRDPESLEVYPPRSGPTPTHTYNGSRGISASSALPGKSGLGIRSSGLGTTAEGKGLPGHGSRKAAAASRAVNYNVVCEVPCGPHAKAMDASTDGSLMAIGGSDSIVRVVDLSAMRTTKVWLQKNNRVVSSDSFSVRTFTGSTAAVTSVSLSRSSTHLAAGFNDSMFRIYEYGSPSALFPVSTVVVHSPVTHTRFHPLSSRFCFTGHLDGTVRLFDLATESFLSAATNTSSSRAPQFAGAAHRKPVTALDVTGYSGGLASSPLVASSGGDGTIAFYDPRSLSVVSTILNPHGGCVVDSLKFSYDGSYLLSAGRDSKAHVWDLRGGSGGESVVSMSLQGKPRAGPSHAAWSRDERHIYTMTSDCGAFNLMDSYTGKRVSSISGPVESGTVALESLPNINGFVAAGKNQMMRLFEVSPAL